MSIRQLVAQCRAAASQQAASLTLKFEQSIARRSQASAHAWQIAGARGPWRPKSVAATVQISLQSRETSCNTANSDFPPATVSTHTCVSVEQVAAHSVHVCAVVIPWSLLSRFNAVAVTEAPVARLKHVTMAAVDRITSRRLSIFRVPELTKRQTSIPGPARKYMFYQRC